MDPTDARALVRELCRREGVELGRVLGRDREVAKLRKRAMLELLAQGMSRRGIAKVFRRSYGTVQEIIGPWLISSTSSSRWRRPHAFRMWRPGQKHTQASLVSNPYFEQWAEQLSRQGTKGPLVELPINLSAASGETTLVAAVAGRRIVIVSLDLTPADALTFAIWSGTVAAGTRITGDIVGNAGGEYVWIDKITHADNVILNINRGSAVAIAGSLTYRLL